MILSAQTLKHIEAKENVLLPTAGNFDLPEKVLQFGTGILLRGLPDYFIDKANKKGVFNGRIVMVKSTAGKSNNSFEQQDNIYTHCIRGFHRGETINQYIVNTSISRVLNANEEWHAIMECATSKDMQVVISNTTEVGIILKEDEVLDGTQPPQSFPGKLLAFLHKRYIHFKGAADAGMVILPTELITGNGAQLKEICLTLAQKNYADTAFEQWLTEANDFCDTLVDRIVPGAMPEHESQKAAQHLGFDDELMIMSEPYSLWAIQTTKERTKNILSFAQANDGIVITANIEKFKDIKLRLLNGAHTFSCGLALLSGFDTVKEAMHNASFEKYIQELMLKEISPTLVSESISEEEAIKFSASVMDRFRNPFIEHKWEAISLNFTSKMALRNVPTILEWYKRKQIVPKQMAMGFAAYLYFLKSEQHTEGALYRHCYGKQIKIEDMWASLINNYWKSNTTEAAIHAILSDKDLWNTDLTTLPGFEEAIVQNIKKLKEQTKKTIKLV